MTSSVQEFYSKVEKLLKSGNLAAAEVIYQQIYAKFLKNAKEIQVYQRLKLGINPQISSNDEVPKEKLLELVNLFTMKKYAEVLLESEEIIKRYPKSHKVLNVVGVANSALGKYETIQPHVRMVFFVTV